MGSHARDAEGVRAGAADAPTTPQASTLKGAADTAEGPLDLPTGAPTVAGPVQPAPLAAGLRLDRWVLERRLGKGATAEVWAARHAELDAPVAIKLFRGRAASLAHVLGEAKAAAGIPSPNAIWVYDAGEIGGHQAIVMELCGGGERPPRSLADADDLSPAEAARLIAEAARGVAAAHAGHVFHKDIKPANILQNPLDGRAQITDFGLASPSLWRRPAHAPHPAASTLWLDADGTGGEDLPAPRPQSPTLEDHLAPVRGGVRVGTPEFMAPEQAAGLRRDLDPHDPRVAAVLRAIDVYGLGATLYTLLAGEPPFPHGTLAGRSDLDAEAILAQILEGPPPPLRARAPHVPARLAAIVARAMAPDPRDGTPAPRRSPKTSMRGARCTRPSSTVRSSRSASTRGGCGRRSACSPRS
jgi:serine/threonine protein kinase